MNESLQFGSLLKLSASRDVGKCCKCFANHNNGEMLMKTTKGPPPGNSHWIGCKWTKDLTHIYVSGVSEYLHRHKMIQHVISCSEACPSQILQRLQCVGTTQASQVERDEQNQDVLQVVPTIIAIIIRDFEIELPTHTYFKSQLVCFCPVIICL